MSLASVLGSRCKALFTDGYSASTGTWTKDAASHASTVNLTQSDSAIRPVATTTPGGVAAVDFQFSGSAPDATADSQLGAGVGGLPGSYSGEYLFCLAFNLTSTGAEQQLWRCDNDQQVQIVGENGKLQNLSGTPQAVSNASVLGAWHTGIFVGNSTNTRLWIDGTQQSTTGSGSTFGAGWAPGGYFNSFEVGPHNAGGAFVSGELDGVLASLCWAHTDTTFSAQDIADIHSALNEVINGATGALVGSSAGTASDSSTARGDGALAGTADGTCSLYGNIDLGATQGSTSGDCTVTGAITGAGALASTEAGTCSVSATIAATGALAANDNGTADATATPSGEGSLAGTIAALALAAATLLGVGDVVGSTSGSASTSATGAAIGALVATDAGTASATGTATGAGTLAGLAEGTCTTYGTTGSGAGSGTSAGTCTVVGTGTVIYQIVGTTAGTCSLSGNCAHVVSAPSGKAATSLPSTLPSNRLSVSVRAPTGAASIRTSTSRVRES